MDRVLLVTDDQREQCKLHVCSVLVKYMFELCSTEVIGLDKDFLKTM